MKKITRTLLTLWVAAGLFLSACASLAAPAGLSGTSWKLVSYGPVGNPTPVASGIATNLDFGKDGTVNGNFGCNSFSGNYQVTNGKIAFSMMISTMMACVGPQMNQEDIGLKIMNGAAPYKLAGSTLTIYAASGANAITLSR
jgi:heat shock protein HslJ